MKLLSWTNGWKTYLTVAAGISVGVAQHFGYHVPGYLDWILGFLGLGFGRMAITRQSQITADAVLALITDALQQLSEPVTTTVVTTSTPPKSVVLASDDTKTATTVSTGPVSTQAKLPLDAPVRQQQQAVPSTRFGALSDR